MSTSLIQSVPRVMAALTFVVMAATPHAQKPQEPASPPAPKYKDLGELLRALPAASPPAMDVPRAIWFTALPLSCVDELQGRPTGRSYFWQPTYRTVDRYEKTRAFYGCGDWQSAVSATLTLVRLMKVYPDLSVQAIAREKLNDHLAKENLDGELAYVKDVAQFQRPYGWAWLLKLQTELLTWRDPDAEKWASHVAPLAAHFAEALVPYLDDLERANKTATTGNTALSLGLILDYANTANASALGRAVERAATRFFGADEKCATDKEAATPEMVSPCLVEAALMSRVLPAAKFVPWLDKFLPPAHMPAFAPLLSVSIDKLPPGRRGGRGPQTADASAAGAAPSAATPSAATPPAAATPAPAATPPAAAGAGAAPAATAPSAASSGEAAAAGGPEGRGGRGGGRGGGAPVSPRVTWMALALTRAEAYHRIAAALPAVRSARAGIQAAGRVRTRSKACDRSPSRRRSPRPGWVRWPVNYSLLPESGR